MQSLDRRYVQYINTTSQSTGTLWEGRYRASVVIEMITRRVQTRLERKRTEPQEWMVVTRRPLTDGGKSEVGMDAYQVRIWDGWHHHMVLALIAVWCLIGETHQGQQLTPALTLPQVRYGLSMLLLEAFCTLSVSARGVES